LSKSAFEYIFVDVVKHKINNVVEGTMMKSRFFPRKDEIVLSTVTALVVGGLLWVGFASFFDEKREHSIFRPFSEKVSNPIATKNIQ
jgi:hypothetical protein